MAVIASKYDRSLPSDEKIDTVATPELCKKYAELFEQAIDPENGLRNPYVTTMLLNHLQDCKLSDSSQVFCKFPI